MSFKIISISFRSSLPVLLVDFCDKFKTMSTIFYKSLAIIFLFTFSAQAQQTVSGTVIDSETKSPIFGVRIDIDGQGKAKTDYDGKFSLKLLPGTYTFKASNVTEGYLDAITELVVKAGEDLTFDVELSTNIKTIDVIKVVGYRSDGPSQTDEEALRKRSGAEGTTEELSGETIKRSGPTSAVDAVQMIPGASVQDGRDVYMRGLGDRYTKTILNGMEIPGLDPDRNTVQLDIFPAVLIDNISVFKTFTPNLTADFTGGLINIQTIDLPSKRTVFLKSSFGYNSNATFNNNFFKYEGGAIDFLGFDDGTRGLNLNPAFTIPNPASNEVATTIATKSFSKVMSTGEAFSFLNQSYSAAYGDQKEIKWKKDSNRRAWRYGYNAVINYRNTNQLFEDVQFNEYIKNTDRKETELFQDRSARGSMAQNNVLWTALLSQGFRFERSKFDVTVFHTQNGTTSAAQLRETNYDSNQAILLKEGLQYTQRSVTNVNFGGFHKLDTANMWKLKWNVAPTYSRIADPDIRSTVVEESDQVDANGDPIYLFDEAVGSEVRRLYRSLTEYNLSGRFDIDYDYKTKKNALKSTIAFGGLNTFKSRSFDVYEYIFRMTGMSNVVPNDPNWFFQDENIWTPETGSGVYAVGQLDSANIYQATQNISSVYGMHTLPIDSSFQITYGVRVERNVNHYTGKSNNGMIAYNNQKVADTINILPSVNMVYKLTSKAKDAAHFDRTTNFRAAYTQTVARPSFREISISQIFDPIQGRRYLGNIDLKPTQIHNADLRWETFFGRSELVSASAFYKRFINPIEVVANVAAPNEFKPVNAGVADVYGVEFELRKMIGFRAPGQQHQQLMVGANMAYILSRIDMNQVKTEIGGVEFTEKEVRENNARDGEVIDDYRQMYGQAPYVVNAFLNYRNDSLGFMVNVSYNVQGKKLAVIGIGINPDVYEQPFHSLNLKMTKYIGQPKKMMVDGIEKTEDAPRWQVGIQGTNLLNNATRRFYESYNAESQVFDYFHPGVTITGSISYTIN